MLFFFIHMKKLLFVTTFIFLISACSKDPTENATSKIGEVFAKMESGQLSFADGILEIDNLLNSMKGQYKDNPQDILNIYETKITLLYNYVDDDKNVEREEIINKMAADYDAMGDNFKQLESYWNQKASIANLQRKSDLDVINIFTNCLKSIPNSEACKKNYEMMVSDYTNAKCVDVSKSLSFAIGSEEKSERLSKELKNSKGKSYYYFQAALNGTDLDTMEIVKSSRDKNVNVIKLTLKDESAKLMSQLSQKNVGQHFLVFNKDQLLLAPEIKGPLSNTSIVFKPEDDITVSQLYKDLCVKEEKHELPDNLKI